MMSHAAAWAGSSARCCCSSHRTCARRRTFARDAERVLARNRVAVEFRDERWFNDDIRRTPGGCRRCPVPRRSRFRLVTPVWRTAGWGYIRFHGTRAHPGAYGRSALASRARLLAETFGLASTSTPTSTTTVTPAVCATPAYSRRSPITPVCGPRACPQPTMCASADALRPSRGTSSQRRHALLPRVRSAD
jgi:hypothetical protein